VEYEELAALFQARIGLQISLVNSDFESQEAGVPAIKSAFCSYLHEGQIYSMRQARTAAISDEPWCGRPFITLNGLADWIQETRIAVEEGTLFNLLYERDMLRVKKGQITVAQAMRNDANFRSMPLFDITRSQRIFFDSQKLIMKNSLRLYKERLAEDTAWRNKHAEDIMRAREAFSTCGMQDIPAFD
jgi:hypothetical protein